MNINYASVLLVEFTQELDILFKNNIERHLVHDNILENLRKTCMNGVHVAEICEEGKKILITAFLRMRLKYFCKFYNFNMIKKKRLITTKDDSPEARKNSRKKKKLK